MLFYPRGFFFHWCVFYCAFRVCYQWNSYQVDFTFQWNAKETSRKKAVLTTLILHLSVAVAMCYAVCCDCVICMITSAANWLKWNWNLFFIFSLTSIFFYLWFISTIYMLIMSDIHRSTYKYPCKQISFFNDFYCE